MKSTTLFQHPKGLYYLFLTEMWERFSYYGITAILILYMNKTFALPKEQVYAIYGAYGALIYMTPIVGGFIADKYWGSYKTIVIGTWFIAIGHFIVAVQSEGFFYFYSGLAVIIIGTGLFSPNINSVVGQLYQGDETKRDSGFTLAYMGRNIGTIIAPIVCAWIAARYDWHWAFIVAGFGMFIGLITFSQGKQFFNPISFKPSDPKTISPWLLGLLLIVALILIYLLLQHVRWVGLLLTISVVSMLYILLMHAKKEPELVRTRIFAAIVLTLFYIVFMILLQQSGGALNLFTDTNVDRTILGYTIETGMFQAIEPLALVVLSPIYNYFWDKLALKQIKFSDGFKFLLSLIIMSSSFIVMSIAMFFANSEGKIAMTWLNITYLLQAAGELFIGPIGLAMIIRLIPRKILGTFMGFWVLASSVANFIAAKIGYWITPTISSNAKAIASYQSAFVKLSLMGFMAALILAFMLPYLKRLIR
jgi:proton-dependent oligopeptide transporter, POT family